MLFLCVLRQEKACFRLHEHAQKTSKAKPCVPLTHPDLCKGPRGERSGKCDQREQIPRGERSGKCDQGEQIPRGERSGKY